MKGEILSMPRKMKNSPSKMFRLRRTTLVMVQLSKGIIILYCIQTFGLNTRAITVPKIIWISAYKPSLSRFGADATATVYVWFPWARQMCSKARHIIYTVTSAPAVISKVFMQRFSLFLGQCSDEQQDVHLFRLRRTTLVMVQLSKGIIIMYTNIWFKHSCHTVPTKI